VVRDTVSYRVLAVYRVGEQPPVHEGTPVHKKESAVHEGTALQKETAT
jgi:sarcosine oxidase delta subunit